LPLPETCPRHRLPPGRVWIWDGDAYRAVEYGAEPERWAAAVHPGPDAATITQVTGGLPTSSLSCAVVVAGMLDSLLLEPGRRGLELGCGAGWNAALPAARAGPGRATSVEAVHPGPRLVAPACAAPPRQPARPAHLTTHQGHRMTTHNCLGFTDWSWLNQPTHWSPQENQVEITTDPGTDFWVTTHYGFVRDTGHALLRPVPANFRLRVTFDGDYREQYDQAGLLLRLDDKNWIKTGIEYVDGHQQLSAVVTRDVSDWNVVPLDRITGTSAHITVEMRREGDHVILRYGTTGDPRDPAPPRLLPAGPAGPGGHHVRLPRRKGIHDALDRPVLRSPVTRRPLGSSMPSREARDGPDLRDVGTCDSPMGQADSTETVVRQRVAGDQGHPVLRSNCMPVRRRALARRASTS
ncbi:DUF1349 domain-containing protein, partial [Streptomyces sp. S1A]|uniref:DUF1349 domain-containing protein n=1 Tax=Streptomyces sp. ICN903 TaxID=2964654 RepID=UPI001EDBF7AC